MTRSHTELEVQRVRVSRDELTSDSKWSDGVLIQCEALLQSMCSHVLVEDITSSEIQNSTVVLVLGNQPCSKWSEDSLSNRI